MVSNGRDRNWERNGLAKIEKKIEWEGGGWYKRGTVVQFDSCGQVIAKLPFSFHPVLSAFHNDALLK